MAQYNFFTNAYKFHLILKAIDLGLVNVLHECKGSLASISIERMRLMKKLEIYIKNPHHNCSTKWGDVIYCLQLNRKQASIVFRDLCFLEAYAKKYDPSRIPTDRTDFDRILPLLIKDLQEWFENNFKGLQIL